MASENSGSDDLVTSIISAMSASHGSQKSVPVDHLSRHTSKSVDMSRQDAIGPNGSCSKEHESRQQG